MLVPTVLLPGPGGERAYDLFSRLLSDRTVLLGAAIDGRVANHYRVLPRRYQQQCKHVGRTFADGERGHVQGKDDDRSVLDT